MSKTTLTTIKRDVPPIKKVNPVTPVAPATIEGKTAIKPNDMAPVNKTLFKMWLKKSVVDLPGLTPGIKPPIFCRFSEIVFGSKVTAV